MKIRLLYLVLSILAISCSNNENYNIQVIQTFPVNKKLFSELVEIDSMPSCPKFLVGAGKYMMLLNENNCDKQLFYVYDKKTFNFIGSFGTYGKGPNELVSPYPTSNRGVENDTLSGFWVKNQKNNRYELVNIEKSLKSNRCIVEDNYYYIPLSEGRGMFTYKVDDDNTIVYSISGEKGRFYSYNSKDESTKWFGFYPKISVINSALSEMALSGIYDSQCDLSMDGKVFVAAVGLAKRIDVFNNKLDHQVSVLYSDSPKVVSWPSEDADWHNTYTYFPGGIYVGKTRIYLLSEKVSLSGIRGNDNPEMHVFSLEGKAIARYQLDNKEYVRFIIDEESNSILFLSNTDEGYPQITRYIIPG